MSAVARPPLETQDFSHVDLDAFLADLQALRAEINASLGPEDLEHLYKIERIGRAAAVLGYATSWMGPNPVSIAGLALGRSTRWLLMHHIGHRGYDKVPDVPARYTSRVFARGARRFVDWADWMLPEAWCYEHNILHHGFTGEEKDPDLIERNTEMLRGLPIPRAIKYVFMAGLGMTWKASYYAPNTLTLLRQRDGKKSSLAALLGTCYAPYAGLAFVALPLSFAWLGPLAVASAFVNSVSAEIACNLHTFLVVGPNHTGEDLYRFDDKPGSKGETMLRQVIGSVNYATGTELLDYAQLWLNYQIEHHIYPDIPMLQYRKIAPKIREICEKHGIPYVQESVFTRARKMLEIAVGKTSMKRLRQVARAQNRNARAAA